MFDISEYDNSVISDITEPPLELNNECKINSLFENKIQTGIDKRKLLHVY